MRKIGAFPLAIALAMLLALSGANAWGPEGFADTWEDLPAGVCALLPADQAYIFGFYNAQTYYVLMEADDIRTIYVAQPAGTGDGNYLLDLKSAPLPIVDGSAASVGGTGSDYLYLFYDHGGISFNFQRQHDGAWLLSSVQGEGIFGVSPIFGVVNLDALPAHCLPGTLPEMNLATLDPSALPRTIEEAFAMIDTDGYAMVQSDLSTDRLHLRASPSKQAVSYWRYYSGTPVRVLSVEGDWAKVDVCGVEGYMMTSYLAYGEDMLAVERYFPGWTVREEYAEQGVSLYLRPEEATGLYMGTVGAAAYTSATTYYVLANVSDDWFHVVCDNGLTGFAQVQYFWEGNG